MTSEAPPLSSGRILIVEEEPELAAMVAEVLRARGYEVETAADGAIALMAADAGDISAVLSDVAMPGLDGVGLYRALEARRSPPVRCFAFLSAVAPRADINELVVEHQVPILRKPFIVRDLLALVERLLAAP
jgi:DNA-binding response OmpR family regulator